MKIFSITCTRDKNLGEAPKALFSTLSSYGVHVKVLANQTSIFEAYKKGMESCDADLNDIIILCHDDLEILSGKAEFVGSLAACLDPATGIVGLAGTTDLGENAVWWDQTRWREGKHRGKVMHREPQVHATEYGACGRVVALDGLFLAARRAVWEMVGLDKPEHFEGDWDFYDIHYTTRAHLLGYKNYTVPIEVIHDSSGELVGRDSWHLNREAFIKNTKLPLCLLGS
tara:strand:- start:156 stop:839 length:684 start_codon:yes stop_codon:yes gene_type:complete